MACIGFYPGSFDPVTFGHIDIIRRAAHLFDELVIGVGTHHGKQPLFTPAERVAMLEEETALLDNETFTRCRVVTFDNLSVDAAREHDARVIIRGLRDSGDFDYEMQMAGMNAGLAGDIETIFLASSPKVRHVAATFVRQIAVMGGDVTSFVPEHVAQRLAAKVAG
jgi:pantetheine-phosphate adenylyltransferase